MKPSNFDFRLWNKRSNSYWEFDDSKQKIILRNDNIWEIELWSGVCDKNGTKIFEGDIVKFSAYPYYYRVGLIGSAWCIISKERTNELRDIEILTLKNGRLELLEVAGNIHENKDLLEKE